MFKYDMLIDEEDICNYEEEIGRLIQYSHNEGRVLLFAPRRYGKTSILVNVIGKRFITRKKGSIVCYVNLQEVIDMDSVSVRFSHALEEGINKAFPVKSALMNIFELLKSMRPQINIDSTTGETSLSLYTEKGEKKSIDDLFNVFSSLSQKYPMMLIMDEFQDIAFIPEAEALLRHFLQKLKGCAIIISGSKKHLLKDIFLEEKKPFYNWGKSLELKQIPFEKWKPYILNRMKKRKIIIAEDVLKFILESVYYIPNHICKLCSDIFESNENKVITVPDVKNIIHRAHLDTQSRYAEKIAFLTAKQLGLLVVIAKRGYVKEIASHTIISESKTSAGGILQIYKLLLDKGYVEKDENGIRIADPFFAYYLSCEF